MADITDKEVKEKLQKQHKEHEVKSTNFPTEIIDLPSRGLLYPEDHPLASGKIEMKYMTAKEEDILTSSNLIKQGVVLDKLFRSLIVTPINYNELFTGDKNAIMIAARVLGYGKDYAVEITCPDCNEKTDHTIDLIQLNNENIDYSHITRGLNEFEFQLPTSKRNIIFRLLTHKDELDIDREIKAMKKSTKRTGIDPTLSTRLSSMIVEVDGERDRKEVRDFVKNELFAIDSRALRSHISEVTPDVDLSFYFECEHCGHDDSEHMIPMTTDFFWPRA